MSNRGRGGRPGRGWNGDQRGNNHGGQNRFHGLEGAGEGEDGNGARRGRGGNWRNGQGGGGTMQNQGRDGNERRGYHNHRRGGSENRGHPNSQNRGRGRGSGNQHRHAGLTESNANGEGDSEHSEDDTSNPNTSKRKKFEGPVFGFKRIYKFLETEPQEVLLSINKDKDDWKTLLESDDDLTGEKLIIVIETVGQKICADIPVLQQQQTNAVLACISEKFIKKLEDAVRKISIGNFLHRRPNNEMPVDSAPIKVFNNIHQFCSFVVKTMPHKALDYLNTLIVTSLGASAACDPSMELLNKFKSLHDEIVAIVERKREEVERRNKYGFNEEDHVEFDAETPPDSIADIDIIPSIEELRAGSSDTFLRPNKTVGAYNDADHYLDVQFRLLREDFVRPLKNGIATFLKNKHEYLTRRKRMPLGEIRLYTEVRIKKVAKERDSIVYKLQLGEHSYKRIKWQKSKRLLTGSLIVLTTIENCFQTAYFGVVFSRNTTELEKGILTIAWEGTPPTYDEDEEYLMFESEVYLEAYRYTLDILKKLELSTFSMKKFIVDASKVVEPPRYLRQATDLLKVRLVNGEERHIAPMVPRQWPTPDEFGLDENQFEAFRAAISQEFSIIQGPPGTGKTFLGLKVAEILLSNSALWKDADSNPITIVCYTNHALDQFLEGILNYYIREDVPAEIIRIGGRCKSEALTKYTLREVRGRNRRRLPKQYWAAERQARDQINEFENLRATGMNEVTGLQDLQGIISFEALKIWSQIQVEYPKPLWDCLQSLAWLGIDDQRMDQEAFNEERVIRDSFEVRKFPKKPPKAKKVDVAQGKSNDVAMDIDDEDEDYDIDELLDDRLLDDILLEADTAQRSDMGRYLTYLPNCSIRGCDKGMKNILKETQEATRGMTHQQTNVYRERTKHRFRVLENRMKFLTELFRLRNEQMLELPDVTELLTEIRGRVATVHFNRLRMSERWALYFALADRARILTASNVADVEKELSKAQKELRDVIQYGDGIILGHCKVVGLTTTGAAKYNNLLKMMKSKIVIVEEAAEVFEAHIVTCITENCEQLILIGDHRQLRPSPTVYELATKYHLDLSLFERMIKNNLHCYKLKLQHRMRPSIADLVVGPIYEELLNHEHVKNYPDIKGVTKNLFFVTHKEKEKSETDSCSKSNVHEAKLIAALCRYLKLQGYESEQITVLTMYTGQMFLLKKEISSNPTCQGIRITCVDNFQGEESDIILLSLVRSNSDGKIGFLGIDNRICVSLSRARHGMFVIGNMTDMANKSKTWKAIREKLEIQGAIGETLELKCQVHGKLTEVRNAEDFCKVPEGGCDVLCNATLSCTHKCQRVCHVLDTEHEQYRCGFPCLKMCANNAHPCKGKCYEKCPSCTNRVVKRLNCELQHEIQLPCFRPVDGIPCTKMVEKILPCGHKEELQCHVDITDYSNCRVNVEKQLPCGHSRNMPCNVDPESVRCKVPVDKSLEPFCEHKKVVECWVRVEDIRCDVMVPKKIAKCGHEVNVKCRERNSNIVCKSNCTTRLPCGHACVKHCHVDDDPDHRTYECRKNCTRECSEGHKCKGSHHCYKTPCPPCKEKMFRQLPCGHQKELECHVDIKTYECLEVCERIIPDLHCKHKCQNLCYAPCGPCTVPVTKRAICGHGQQVKCCDAATKGNCEVLVKPKQTPSCGHQDGLVPCKHDSASPEDLVKYCQSPCRHEFSPAMGGCGHSCKGTCSSCLQGRIHMKCQEECGRQLVCGHVCEVPCASVCPPCQKPCLMRCEHSECTRKCGEPCSDCQEKCTWKCSHARCTKLCGEMCDRKPCDKPCLKKLKCGHDCVGFCGEPCPPLCRICDNQALTEFFLLGNEEDDDARFVYLSDCGHTIEVEGLEGWLTKGQNGEISSKRCPRCKTTIRNCRRFGNLIRQHYQDVMKVKMRSFGNKANSDRLRNKWILIINQNSEMDRVFPVAHERIRTSLVDDVPRPNGGVMRIPKTIDEFSMRSMDFIADCTLKAAKDLLELKTQGKLQAPHYANVVNVFRKTVDSMIVRHSLSRQEMLDFNEELNRLDYYKQLMMRRCLPTCSREYTDAYTFYAQAKKIVTSTLPFTPARKDTFTLLLKKLDEQLRSGLGISERERQEIVSSFLGMSQGHWFKCPNGHIYVITECGGAMLESRCNECGATIGGGSHRLRSDNQLASEMDGARAAAWPGT